MNACPSAEDLHHLLNERLSPSVVEMLDRHLVDCVACQTRLDQLSDDAELRAWLGSAPASDVRPVLHHETPGRSVHLCGLAAPSREGDLGSLGPYMIEAEVGRGGMGMVFRGRDELLGRTVAVKVLRPELNDPVSRSRFLHEARAAARVRHEHVVRVYAVINPPAGLPYFTMEYIAGPTLAQRLKQAPPLDTCEAVNLIVQIADGLIAAHDVGLVHRDIKPANILLETIGGSARLTDFGLARGTAALTTLTTEGALMGTPAYMSPEQASGSAGADGRSDVYSLGVTLYETLTGEVPFRGMPQVMLNQIVHDPPRSPRQLNKDVPPDLETICLKCLAKEPAARYQTARELADDLRRWQRGEPIRARPPGAVERLRRWCWRRPLAASLTAALVLTSAAGFAGVTWQWWRAEANYRHADANFLEAMTAIRDLADTSERELRTVPGLQPLRRKLLTDAVEQQRRLLREHSASWAMRFHLATTCFELGYVTAEVARLDEAEAMLHEAAALCEELSPDHAEDIGVQLIRGSVYFYLGYINHEAGRLEQALMFHRRALAVYEAIASAHPEEPWCRRNAAVARCEIGRVDLDRNDLAEARRNFNDARLVHERLVREYPNDVRYARQLAYDDNCAGELELRIGCPGQALACFQRAIAVRRQLVRMPSPEVGWQRDLGLTHRNLGLTYRDLHRPTEALRSLEQAQVVFDCIVHENPAVRQFRGDQAAVEDDLGDIHEAAGRHAEALRCFKAARDRTRQLIDNDPTRFRPHLTLARSRVGIAGVHRAVGRVDDALATLQEDRVALDRLALAHPAHPAVQRELARAWLDIGVIEHARGLNHQGSDALPHAGVFQEHRGHR